VKAYSPEEIEKMREIMQTAPEYQPAREDGIYVGVEGIRVQLVDYPANPYRAIYELVTSTWGGRKRWWRRWENAPVEGRIMAVKACLEGKTLQQALEAISFTWKIEGCSRSAFDQLARHRFTAIGSVGMRDNNWRDAALRVPTPLKRYLPEIREWWKRTKDLYCKFVDLGQQSWQNARFILPMGVCWRFVWTMDYRAFRDTVCSRRMMFCEQFDTVYTVYAMWAELRKKFPLLAAYCRPLCDRVKRCVYHDLYSLSAAFGCLFRPCGRWPITTEEVYATFENEAAADPEEIDRELRRNYGFGVPSPDEWDELVEEGLEKDRRWFEE